MVNRVREFKFRVLRIWSPRQGRVFARGVTRIANPAPRANRPQHDIPPKTHGLVEDDADSKTVPPRMDGFL